MKRDKLRHILDQDQTDRKLSLDQSGDHLDAFEADALEGWKSSGLEIATGMKKLDATYHIWKRAIVWKMIGLSFSITVVLVIITHFLAESDERNTSLNVSKKEINAELMDSSGIEVPQILTKTVERFDSDSITHSRNHSILTRFSEVDSTLPLTIIPGLRKLTLQEQSKSRKLRSLKEIYLSGHKLVDYREVRNEIQSFHSSPLTGLHPEFANKEERDSTKVIPNDRAISYYDFVKYSFSKLSDGDTTTVMTCLSRILAVYPDDVNALFYRGYLLFNQHAYSEALKWLIKSSNAPIGNFYDESRWYCAEALRLLGKSTESQKIYREIVLENGFYSKQAMHRIKHD